MKIVVLDPWSTDPTWGNLEDAAIVEVGPDGWEPEIELEHAIERWKEDAIAIGKKAPAE